MRNRIFVLFLTFFSLQLVQPVFSEVREVVVVKSAEIEPYNEALDGFRSSFACDVTEMIMNEASSSDILKKIHGPDTAAVFAIGLDALNLVKTVRDVPVIYAMVPHSPALGPELKGLSGVSMYIPPDRYIGSMLDVFQGAKRIGVIYDPRNSEAFIKEALQAAQARGVELLLRKAWRPADIPFLIDSMKGRIDVFWMLPDATVVNPETVKYLLLFSFLNKVPVFTFSKKYVEIGSAAGLCTLPFEIGMQAGEIARKVVAEKIPKTYKADARKTVVMINRKITRKLGIKIRDDVLSRAEYVD